MLKVSRSLLTLLHSIAAARLPQQASSFASCPASPMSTVMVRKIPQSLLGVSEPNPAMFGNPRNEPSNPRWTNANWLKSRFHFSFAEYSNRANQDFGVLRVMNDDLVQPARGFGTHPHRDAEICTYVVEGSLTHEDSMGTSETLGRGGVQFMTAGRGVAHSEHNLDKDHPLRFIQIWMQTRQRGLPPNYGSFTSTEADRLNKWYHIVSDVQAKVKAPIQINQDANIFVTEMEPGASATLNIAAGRQAYLLCIEGAATLTSSGGTISLDQHDAAEIQGPTDLALSPPTGSTQRAHCLVVEMAHVPGSGRKDL